MAAGLVAPYTERGLKVPESLSVVGFDDSSIATCMRPFLTTVRQPLSDLGARAVRELVASLRGAGEAEARRIVLDHEFVLRDTTAPPENTD
jgi:LacI family transcriptional regulator